MTLEDEPTRRLTATQWLDEYNHDQVLTPTAVKEVNDGSARDMPSAYSLVTDSSSDTRAASNESGDLAVAPGTNRSALEQEEATDGVPDTAAVVPLGLPRGTTSPVVTLESAARAKKNVAVEISRGVACNQQQRASWGKRQVSGPTLQLTDNDIMEAQAKSRLVQRLVEVGEHRGMQVTVPFGMAVIEAAKGRRVVLPPALWAIAFKEAHDSVWAGHLRAPHTYARLSQTYWWPNLEREVKRWVLGY